MLNEAKKANQRAKDLINGYIRSQYSNNNVIPVVINYICLLYYLIKDKFGKHGKLLEVSSNSGSHIVESNNSSMIWNTVYGTVDIDVNKFTNMIVHWTFKIEYKYVVIGIDSSDSEYTERFGWGTNNDKNHYGWYGMGILYSKCPWEKSGNPQFVKGDIIKMELNVPQKVLKYYKNDQDIELQFDDIDVTKTYRLSVSILCYYDTRGKLQMIDSNFIP